MKLYQILGPDFTAGLVIEKVVATKVAPIIQYMQGWNLDKIIAHCKTKNYTINRVVRKRGIFRK